MVDRGVSRGVVASDGTGTTGAGSSGQGCSIKFAWMFIFGDISFPPLPGILNHGFCHILWRGHPVNKSINPSFYDLRLVLKRYFIFDINRGRVVWV